MSTDGVLAAAFIPDDGYLDPSQLTFALADARAPLGAQIETRTTVTGIETRDGRVVAVETDKGRIECEVVVNAAGMYAPEVARLVGVDLPIIPFGHQYLITEPFDAGARAAADAARPGQPRLLPHRGGRARDGRLRAQAGVVGARRHPGRLRGEAPARGLGPDGGAVDERDHARAGDGDAPRSRSSSTGPRPSRRTPTSCSARPTCRASGSPPAAARTASPARAASAR